MSQSFWKQNSASLHRERQDEITSLLIFCISSYLHHCLKAFVPFGEDIIQGIREMDAGVTRPPFPMHSTVTIVCSLISWQMLNYRNHCNRLLIIKNQSSPKQEFTRAQSSLDQIETLMFVFSKFQ